MMILDSLSYGYQDAQDPEGAMLALASLAFPCPGIARLHACFPCPGIARLHAFPCPGIARLHAWTLALVSAYNCSSRPSPSTNTTLYFPIIESWELEKQVWSRSCIFHRVKRRTSGGIGGGEQATQQQGIGGGKQAEQRQGIERKWRLKQGSGIGNSRVGYKYKLAVWKPIMKVHGRYKRSSDQCIFFKLQLIMPVKGNMRDLWTSFESYLIALQILSSGSQSIL